MVVERGKEVVDADRGWQVTHREEVPPLHQNTGEVAGSEAEDAERYPEDPATITHKSGSPKSNSFLLKEDRIYNIPATQVNAQH